MTPLDWAAIGELVYFAAALFGGVIATLLVVLFYRRAYRDDGVYTALGTIFLTFVANWGADVIAAIISGDLAPVPHWRNLATRLALVLSEVYLLMRLLRV